MTARKSRPLDRWALLRGFSNRTAASVRDGSLASMMWLSRLGWFARLIPHPEWSVNPYLLMPDKSKTNQVEGIGAQFRVESEVRHGRRYM